SCQFDKTEQPPDAFGRYVPGAVPQALAGPAKPRARDIDFQGDDGLVQEQPAAVVARDRLQRVGVDLVAGAGTNLADDKDDVLALPGQLAEPGRLLALTGGAGDGSLGHWIDSLGE